MPARTGTGRSGLDCQDSDCSAVAAYVRRAVAETQIALEGFAALSLPVEALHDDPDAQQNKNGQQGIQNGACLNPPGHGSGDEPCGTAQSPGVLLRANVFAFQIHAVNSPAGGKNPASPSNTPRSPPPFPKPYW